MRLQLPQNEYRLLRCSRTRASYKVCQGMPQAGQFYRPGPGDPYFYAGSYYHGYGRYDTQHPSKMAIRPKKTGQNRANRSDRHFLF